VAGVGGGRAEADGSVAVRGRCHAGRSWSRRSIGCPQQGQGRAGAVTGAGVSGGAVSGGANVWREICSRLALAAGWQKPEKRIAFIPRGSTWRR
jgi:hypothetical protein